MRRALMVAVALLVAHAAPAPADQGAGPPGRVSAPGSVVGDLQLVSSQALGPRLRELQFTTSAVPGPTGVRVLLPAGYDAHPRRRYPVLWLLHGALDSYKSWVDKGDAEAITADLPALVVMPDSGTGGGYENWAQDDRPPNPQWETYHIDQLLPWIDAHYRTIPDRGHRAIAGLSMGGFGTMSYAARHPDLFGNATAWSGALDALSPGQYLLAEFNNGDVGAVHGLRATEEVRWRSDNPVDLAANLRDTVLTIRTGNGLPGGPAPGDTGDPVEAGAHDASANFHAALEALGISHTWDDYGPGGHNWFYWQRGLRQLVPDLTAYFADPPPAPKRFDFRAVEPVFGVYGWRVSMTRPALEFAALEDARPRGFELSGSGSAVVRTARFYRPGSIAHVAIGSAMQDLRVGPRCRLAIPVDLGPGNPEQAYRPGVETIVRAVTVHIAARRGCRPSLP